MVFRSTSNWNWLAILGAPLAGTFAFLVLGNGLKAPVLAWTGLFSMSIIGCLFLARRIGFAQWPILVLYGVSSIGLMLVMSMATMAFVVTRSVPF